MTSLPPDRSHVATEGRHGQSAELDRLDTTAIVDLLIEDHRAVTQALRDGRAALTDFIDALVPRVAAGGRLISLGAGTSGRLAVLDASECPPTFQSDPGQIVGLIAGGDSALRRSSEGAEDDPRGAAAQLAELSLGERDTVLAIAAGGTTPYSLGALELAKARGAMTALLSCADLRQPPASCDHLLLFETGPEVLTGSTRLKAGSATKLALNIVTTALFVRLGKTYGHFMVDLRASNAKLLDRAIRVVMAIEPTIATRADAAGLIARAGGSVKVAIAMSRLGVDRGEAERRLASAGGRLRDVLDG